MSYYICLLKYTCRNKTLVSDRTLYRIKENAQKQTTTTITTAAAATTTENAAQTCLQVSIKEPLSQIQVPSSSVTLVYVKLKRKNKKQNSYAVR